MSSPYLAKQFSGPLAQAAIDTVKAQYALSDPMIDYWHGLSIDTAAAPELTAIGYLVGLPWPATFTDTMTTNCMILGASASYPTASTVGLGKGVLWSNNLATAAPIPIDNYRQLLKAYAYLKWYGLTWKSIDAIAASFGNLSYSFSSTISNAFTLGSSGSYPTASALGLSTYTGSSGGALTSSDPGYFPDSDIIISYSTPLSLGDIYLLQTLFAAVCTAPKVTVRNGV